MYKKFFIFTLIATIIILLLIIPMVWYIDPFFQYHKPFIGININTERYQNAGIAKNFEYNSIITGSSMTENFRVSWFKELFPDDEFIKVPYSGGYSKDYNNIFEIAFKTHEIKNVYFGMDEFNLFKELPTTTRTEYPKYLYDDNLLNDIYYIFNKDVIFNHCLANIKNNISGNVRDIDLAYNWNEDYEFSEEVVKAGYERSPILETQDNNCLMEYYDENLRNITKYIEEYPETNFHIFFPPYSILEWDNAIRTGKYEAQIANTKRVMEDLLKYDNVELYYFQNIEEIITNLDNYKDYSHYNEDINYYMLQCMYNGKHKITEENYINEIQKMRNIIENFDFEALFED